ncbi:MAG TPA: sulfotransferase [Steroidobacteraceae bacterium]|nr:sulfotransferase [Steroidobacteraceae bacterium]
MRLHSEVLRFMQTHDWRSAEASCRQLVERYPEFAAGWYAASQIALAQGRAVQAFDAIARAVDREPKSAAFQLHRAACLLALRRRRDALDAVELAERCAAANPAVLDAAGTLLSNMGEQRRALAAYDQAVALAPTDARFRYNRASVRRFLGDLEGAEADLDRTIALNPRDFEAQLNRSQLRTQTAERNHVGELEALAANPLADWRDEVQIRYALAKEYEDLGLYAKSFVHLRRGADKRREHLRYEVANDIDTVSWIMEAFPAAPREPTAGAVEDSPVFIVGLPRSGSTLIERILGSHSSLTSAGELNCFALALVDAARARAGRALPRRELVALSAMLDFAALGRDYLRRAHDSFGGAGRFIDKMPLNYLYCGLILRALPNAKIIHVTRHPMAVAYAMYKTLFKHGYPFSYDLTDIARYYGAYRRLMDHWRRSSPGAIYEVSYEGLVADQLGETRGLLAHCGLDWEESCAAFHQNPSASTTASASQVRRPIYGSSVAQWRHYEAELAPLKEALKAFL